MNTHSTPSFQRIYKEFINTILNKYCDETKVVSSLGCYNDDLVDQIVFKDLVLVDKKFGPCKYKDESNLNIAMRLMYEECEILDFLNRVEYKNVFDVVIMSTVIEHLPNPQEILSMIKTVLKPNGVFIITYPNAFSPNRCLGWQLKQLIYPDYISERDREVGHVKMYGVNDLEKFTYWLKLRIIEFIGIMYKPLPHSMMSEYFKNDLEKFIELGYKLGPRACSYIGGVFQKND